MTNAAPYSRLPNSFKRDLQSGTLLVGCWASLASPIATEVVGLAGFDWLLLDGEHAPNDVTTFIPQLMALGQSSSAPVVRPKWNDAVEIKRLLDIGFSNLLIPFVETADDARAAVAATRYPPQGIRGVSVSMRGNMYGTVKGYHALANDNVAVIVQIETPKAIAHLDAICQVDGVDAVFIGPSDLAASHGHLGDASHPDVQQAMATIVDTAKRHNRPIGILAPVESDARRYMQMGMTLVAVGSDLGALRSSTQALRDAFKPR